MKNVMKVMVLCFFSAIAVNANAAIVNAGDQLLFGGGLDIGSATTLDAATSVQLSTVDGTLGTGGIDDVWGWIGSGGGAASLTTSFSPVAGFMSIDNTGSSIIWTFDMSTLSIVEPTMGSLWLEGTGILSDGAGDHAVTWALTAQSATSYSMDMTVVPVPAAVWLFGSGLIGLVGLARRKA